MARVRFKRDGPAYTPKDRVNRQGDFAQKWADDDLPRFAKGIMLAAEIEFVFPRPDAHFGTGRNAGILKARFLDARPTSGTYGGDLDNLVKLVTDALNGIAYHDDSQLATVTAEKRFAMPIGDGLEAPRTRITLRPL